MDRGLVPEVRPLSGRAGIDAVDRVDPEHAPVLLGLARGADGARDAVADPQAEAADLAGRDVDVIRAGQQAVPAHEPEALVDDVEDAGGVVVAGPLGLALEDPIDQVFLALRGVGVELEILADRPELLLGHRTELDDVEVVALAGGLDLLHLVEFADGRARGGLGTAPGPAVAGSLIALIGTDGRHMGRTHERG